MIIMSFKSQTDRRTESAVPQ